MDAPKTVSFSMKVTAQALLEEHQDGRLEDRPQRIKGLREEFRAYTGLVPPRRIGAVQAWYRSRKSHITKGLREHLGHYDDESDDVEEGGDS